jgi:hypothetical protein
MQADEEEIEEEKKSDVPQSVTSTHLIAQNADFIAF